MIYTIAHTLFLLFFLSPAFMLQSKNTHTHTPKIPLQKNFSKASHLRQKQTLPTKNKQFIIMIASYNNKKWYKLNLSSIFNQTYKCYRIIYIDDNSSDQTGDLVKKYILKHGFQTKTILIKNKSQHGALENIYNAIHKHCKDNDIIVIVDGDDWLAHPNVLSYLNKIYSDPNVWMTYGQAICYPRDTIHNACQIPTKIIKKNSFRKCDWVKTLKSYWPADHLRTFYTWLFKKIKKEDLQHENKFFTAATDVAAMVPMLEMAGTHSKFISDILYVYNQKNPLNLFKIKHNKQQTNCKIICKKQKYKPIFTQTSQNKSRLHTL